MTKEIVFIQALAKKANRLKWRVSHDQSYAADLGQCTVVVSLDPLGYHISLFDSDSRRLIESRNKETCEDVYKVAQLRALEIDKATQEALRVLEAA